VIALVDLAFRIWSWLWAHWKGVLVILVAAGVLWGLWTSLEAYGDRRAAEAVLPWQEAARKAAAAAGVAQAEADARGDREARAVAESNRRIADARAEIDRLDANRRALTRRLQNLAARRNPMPEPAELAGCLRELAGERALSARGAELLARGGDLLARVERDRALGAAAAVNVCGAWPR